MRAFFLLLVECCSSRKHSILAVIALVVITVFIVYGLYFGLTEGVEKAFVADLTSAELRGTAFGLYHLTIGIGALPALASAASACSGRPDCLPMC